MSPLEIKELRLKLKKTQEEFARVLGVAFPTVNRWENGVTKPSRLALDKLKATAKELNALKT